MYSTLLAGMGTPSASNLTLRHCTYMAWELAHLIYATTKHTSD
jgi:hypothetical protein